MVTYLNLLKCQDWVVFRQEQLANDDLFVKFMSSSAVRLLTDEQITESLLVIMCKEIGDDEVFVKALTYGLVRKLSNQASDFL